MKIGIVSDSHGRVETVQSALVLLRDQGAELLIHCGDIDDADAVRAVGSSRVDLQACKLEYSIVSPK